MKNLYFLSIALLTAISSYGQVFISELSYFGTTLQAVEISGPAGIDVSNWKIRFNGNTNRNVYNTVTIPTTTIIDDEGSGYGALSFSVGFDIRDTANTGIYLENASGALVGQFLSWNGTFDGKGIVSVTSTDIGVIQSASANSLQLTDSGWIVGTGLSFGTLNANLTLSVVKNQIENFAMYPNPVSNGMLYMSSANNVNKQVDIYAINGQKVYSKNLQLEEKMNISNLNRGIYFVRIEEEGKIATRKLLVN